MTNDRDPLLELLRRNFGDRWRIRRTEHLLIANANDPETRTAPTIIEPLERVSAFIEQLSDPPPRAGMSLLDVPFFRSQLEEIAPGVYIQEKPHP